MSAKTTEQILKKLTESTNQSLELLKGALDLHESIIKENLSKKEQVKYKAFISKYSTLVKGGHIKEAEALKKEYSEQI
jgi:hypothetical protein